MTQDCRFETVRLLQALGSIGLRCDTLVLDAEGHVKTERMYMYQVSKRVNVVLPSI